MNTARTPRLVSFAFAALLTVALLAGIDGIATAPAPASLIAQITAPAAV